MGFKALGKGVLVGGGTLLASPVLACAGAKEEGAAGAVKGFAVGTLGGAALMIGGAVQAVTQVGIWAVQFGLGRANLTGLVLGCIEARFCKKICV